MKKTKAIQAWLHFHFNDALKLKCFLQKNDTFYNKDEKL